MGVAPDAIPLTVSQRLRSASPGKDPTGDETETPFRPSVARSGRRERRSRGRLGQCRLRASQGPRRLSGNHDGSAFPAVARRRPLLSRPVRLLREHPERLDGDRRRTDRLRKRAVPRPLGDRQPLPAPSERKRRVHTVDLRVPRLARPPAVRQEYGLGSLTAQGRHDLHEPGGKADDPHRRAPSWRVRLDAEHPGPVPRGRPSDRQRLRADVGELHVRSGRLRREVAGRRLLRRPDQARVRSCTYTVATE